MNGEIMYELDHSSEAPPQCCFCNQPAEHKCSECGEFICREHARACEFCEVAAQSDAVPPYRPPRRFYCDAHINHVNGEFCICEEHLPDFRAEMDEVALSDVMAADRVEAEVMA